MCGGIVGDASIAAVVMTVSDAGSAGSNPSSTESYDGLNACMHAHVESFPDLLVFWLFGFAC